MQFEYDRRGQRWSVSHDPVSRDPKVEYSWADVPPDGPSQYMRWHERRRLPRKPMAEVEGDL